MRDKNNIYQQNFLTKNTCNKQVGNK